MNGKELRDWRDFMGWSQDQAGKALGRGRRGYQELESSVGHIDPNIEANATVLKVAKTCDLSKIQGEAKTLFAAAKATIEAIDAMPGAGRPKKEYNAALEDLYDAVFAARGHLINMQNMATGSLHRDALRLILGRLEVAETAKILTEIG